MEKRKKKGWLKWQAVSLLTAALVCVLAGVAAPVRGKAAYVDNNNPTVLIVENFDAQWNVINVWNNSITTVRFDDSVPVIPEAILYSRSSVTTVEFQGAVTSIGDSAFWGCSSLTGIDLSTVTSIGDSAFWGCSSLTGIDLSTVTTVGESVFANCSGLTNIDLSTVTAIGNNAFGGCSSLSDVTWNESLTSIGSGAFSGTAIKEIDVPSSVTTIGDSVFSYCSKLSEVFLNEGLQSIGSCAFQNCSSLTRLEIPSSVTTIGEAALSGTKLTEIRYPAVLDLSKAFPPQGAVTISYTIDGTGAKTYTCDNNKHNIVDEGSGVYDCSRCDYVYNLRITQQPSDVTVKEGDNAEFTVTAAGDGPLSYQWEVSKDAGKTWTNIGGAMDAAYRISKAESGWNNWQYRCAVTNSEGIVTVRSAAASLTITAAPEPPVSEETEETPPAPELPVPETPEETPAAPEETEAPIETQESQPAVTAEEEQSARESLNRQVQAGATYNRLRWTRVKGADGYIIYGSKCSSGDKKHKMKELKTIASGRKTSWTHKGLKKNTWYKYQIAAYKLVNGKQVEIGSSVSLHSLTQGDGRYANPVRVKVSRTKITLKKGRNTVIKAEAVLPKGKKTEHHTEEIRYVVSDPEIVSVTKNGKIKGKKKGSCTVYAVAQNGVYQKIKVKVK